MALWSITLILIVLAIYFLPLIIANNRNLSNVVSIGFLNLFLGWTLIGWVVALCWASAATANKAPAIAPSSFGEM